MGRGNESLFAASGSHDQDGHHAHIYSAKKESLHFLDRNFSNSTQTHSFEKYAYIKGARLIRQPCKNVSKLIRRL